MASPIGLLGMFADAMILMAVAAGVARSSVSRLARPVIATAAFASAWFVAVVLEAARAPAWATIIAGAVIGLTILAIIATLHVWTRGEDGGESDPEDRGDGGGPRRRAPDAPPPAGGDSGLDWWPEFEHQLALYMAERERGTRAHSGGPASQGIPANRRFRKRDRRRGRHGSDWSARG
jgi:hypothetical protein